MLNSEVSQQFGHIGRTHPENFQKYHNGMFSINRITKHFQETPFIWHWNKQLMLMDASNQRTGIASMTNLTSAHQRWAE